MFIDPNNPFADLVPAQSSGPVFGPPPKPEPAEKPPSGFRWKDESHTELVPITKGPADPYRPGGELDPDKPGKDPKAQESERTAAYLATNLSANVALLNDAIKKDPSAAAPTIGQEVAGIFGQTARNFATPAQRQVVYNAQRLITDAALTLGTGAAYTKEQIDAYTRGFFPQVGDSPEAIKSKSESLRAALIAARIKAGSNAPKIDEAMQMLGMDPNAPATGKSEDALTLGGGGPASSGGGEGGGPPGMSELTPEQQQREREFRATNPTAEQYAAFLSGMLGKQVPVENAKARLEAAAKGAPYNPGVEEKDYQEKIAERIAEENKLGLGTNPANTLGMQGGTFNLSDEASGIGEAAANVLTSPFTGNFDPVFAYQFGRDLERQRIDNARGQLGYGGTALEFASGMAGAGPSRVGGSALGALVQAAPRASTAAGVTGGALAGFGSGEGAEESMVGVGAGGALGYLLPKAVGRVLPGARAPQGMDPRLGAAAEAESVRISQPMIEGNRSAVNRAGRLEADPSAAAYIQQGFGNTASDIEAGVGRLGSGAAQDRGAMGETLRQAAKDIQRVDREGATAAYDAARSAQPDATVDPVEMRSAIDAKLAQLQRRPEQNRETIRELQRYRADLDKPLPLQEIRDMRTDAYDNVSGLNIARTSSAKKADRFMMQIIDASKKDVQSALTPEALAAWQAADKQFAENQTLYRTALKPLLGEDFDKLSGEAIFERVKSAANRDGRALAGFHRRLTAEQSRDFAATIAEGLGRRSTEEPFSPQLFMQQARKFSPSARETIFGPSGAASFNNLLLLSRRLERAQSQVNTSKTARPVVAAIRQKATLFLTALLTGGGAVAGGGAGAGVGVAVGGAAMLAGAAKRGLSAKALMNPRVSRWMADAADVETPGQAKELTRRLGGIIAREPTIANDLQPVYDFLQQRLTGPLAADQAGGDDEQQ